VDRVREYEPGVDLVTAFERSVDALAHDPSYREVEIVERRARKNGRTHELALVIDREGGLDVGTCERISAYLNDALEAYGDLYELSVASAGLDRPLVRPTDYERFAGRDVLIKTTLPINHEYTHEGKLLGLRGTTILLQNKKGELPIPHEMVKSANLVYDFRADLRRAKQEKRERGT
jgi:ribosome maturation factor RimP